MKPRRIIMEFTDENHVLVAYFTTKSQLDINRRISQEEIGNTAKIANMIKENVSCDLYEIETEYEYPQDMKSLLEIAKKEMDDQAYPPLLLHILNMKQYDIIFLGYPNWYNTMPRAVFSFLNDYDFSKKTIIPFCTHGGGGLGNSIEDMKKILPNNKILEAIAIKDSEVEESSQKITEWIKNL